MQGWQKLSLALIALALASGAWADSNVRFVRFSLVTGAVEVQLPGEHQWHPALLDGPVVAGERVRTLASGRAEIQLEHGSTLRLIPNSQLSFPKLALTEQGVFVTTARVDAGTAFVTVRKDDGKQFQLLLPQAAAVVPEGDASLRADAAAVTVLAGKARLRQGDRQLALKKDQQADLAQPLRATFAGASDPWTRWSRTRDAYYEAAFHHGVEPGSLSTYVNWGAALPPMPTYTGTGLTYAGTTACPWTVNSGDFQGWCWSQAQGWYLPAQVVVADPVVAASASDISQTQGQLRASIQPGNGLGGFQGMPAMVLNTNCGVTYFFAGQNFGNPFQGCPVVAGYGASSLWADNYFFNNYNGLNGGGSIGSSAATGASRDVNPRRPLMPGQRFLPGGHAPNGHLSPPPPLAFHQASLRPPSGGIQPSRLGFRAVGGSASGARMGASAATTTGLRSFARSGLGVRPGLGAPAVGLGMRAATMGGPTSARSFSAPSNMGAAPAGGGGMASGKGGSGPVGRVVH